MKKLFVIVGIIFLSLTGCDQWVSRNFGGTTTIELQPGEKLVEATWKNEGDLWYLVEPMDSNYIPKTKIFKESSAVGVLEGQVIFIEKR